MAGRGGRGRGWKRGTGRGRGRGRGGGRVGSVWSAQRRWGWACRGVPGLRRLRNENDDDDLHTRRPISVFRTNRRRRRRRRRDGDGLWMWTWRYALRAILSEKNKTPRSVVAAPPHARSCRCGVPRASWWHGPLLLSERHARGARLARGHRWESARASRRSAPVGRVRFRNRDRRADFFDDEPRPRALRALRTERIEQTRLVVGGRTTSSSRSCG